MAEARGGMMGRTAVRARGDRGAEAVPAPQMSTGFARR